MFSLDGVIAPFIYWHECIMEKANFDVDTSSLVD